MLLGFGGAATSAVSEGPQPIHTVVASGDEVTAGAGTSPGERFRRTELYFGQSRPGGEVTEEDFAKFLRSCPVAPCGDPSRPPVTTFHRPHLPGSW